MFNKIICSIIGHKSRVTSCPFTLLKYDICDRCQGSVVIGRVNDEEQNSNISA